MLFHYNWPDNSLIYTFLRTDLVGGYFCEIKSSLIGSYRTKVISKTNQPIWNSSFDVPMAIDGTLKIVSLWCSTHFRQRISIQIRYF